MTYEIREVTVDDVLGNPHSLALFTEHWEEIALNKQVMVLKPDTDRYRTLESAGMVLILAAYLGDELVGYSVNFLTNHLHYADLRVASNDLLFVTPQHRASRVGLQLIRGTESAAKARGSNLMLWHAKEHTALATLMPKLGYGVQDIIFSREL